MKIHKPLPTGRQVKSQEGFTLIEALIYATLLGIFLGSVIIVVGNILASTDSTLVRNEILANQEFVEQKLSWLAEQATAVTEPLSGSSSTRVVFTEPISGTNPAIFELQDGKIMLTLGSGESAALTNNRVRASDFTITHYTLNGASLIRVLFGLEHVVYGQVTSTTTLTFIIP